MRFLAQGSAYFKRVLAFVLAIQLVGCGGSPTANTPPAPGPGGTVTPIKHVIIVIGENHSFDNIFATYQPGDKTQQVWNLLSRQIVTTSGAPGANFAAAAQHQAMDNDIYRLSPAQTGPFATLPQPNTTLNPLLFPPAVQYGVASDPGLAPADQKLLNDGGIFPQFYFIPDKRFPADMPDGPFPITQYVKYSDTVGDPVHRFFQMWQEIDCNPANISSSNPSGCTADLFPWVATSVGWGLENTPPPPNFTDQSTFQGAVSMGFYNMAAGDVPYFASLANTYAMSDNYHQFILGGTGPNSISIGTAAPLVYSDANGNPTTPPTLQVNNPDPYPGSNNWYQKDGFYLGNTGNESNAAYTNCSDPTQPGVPAIMNYLAALPYKAFNSGNCAAGTYYLLNNQDPAYDRNGILFPDQSHTVGPSSVATIGDALSAAGISWKYYGEGYSSNGLGGIYSHYCDICNPFQYAKSIMTTNLKSNLQDITQFYQDVQNGTLPAVSFVKPDDIVDSHPGTSLPELFEAFSRNLVDTVKQQGNLWPTTAIFITMDESGGYYDSGYIQPIDYFGDGPRIPLIVVSPFAKPGYVDHTYGDHASLLKFIEMNWGLKPLSSRSRDNLPNPASLPSAPYFPTNSPAIGDLTTMFNF